MTTENLEGQSTSPDLNPVPSPDVKPSFPHRQTPLSPEARDELDKVVGDFVGQLESLAREKARSLRSDSVQSVNVRDACAELMVTRLDEVANVGVVILLPVGLFLLGISGNAVIGAWTGQPTHWAYVLVAWAGGLISGASLAFYFTKATFKRIFARHASGNTEDH